VQIDCTLVCVRARCWRAILFLETALQMKGCRSFFLFGFASLTLAYECRPLCYNFLNPTPFTRRPRCPIVNIYFEYVLCCSSTESFSGFPLSSRRFQRFRRRRRSPISSGTKQLFHGQHIFLLFCPPARPYRSFFETRFHLDLYPHD
jgi:hypothetical protein